MAKLNPESAWEFADAIKAIVKPQSNRRKATVQNVDKDGAIWVSLPGSSTVTPIQSTGANVSPGDTVLTELRGTSLHITENQTNPAIGENTARSIAKQETQHAEAMAKQAKTIADEAQAVAEATNQHFWNDTNGAHITDVTQDEWTAAVADNFSDYDPDAKPYHNQLLNSLGILLRTALNNLVSITRSAIAFYDGTGNTASNIVARFGSSGAQIGKSNAAHSVIDAAGQRFYGDSHGTTQLANIGYGEGASAGGTATTPYYTFGKRETTTDAYSPTETYEVGERVQYNGAEYVCTTAITTPEAWTSAHWRNPVGNWSLAEGYETTASGARSHAEGEGSLSLGSWTHAEGYITYALGKYSHSEGKVTTASGETAHAEGDLTTASGNTSHAEGYSTTASGNYSHAQNYNTKAASEAQTAIGKYNDNNPNNAFEIGNGTADNARSNAFAVTWSGAADLSHTLTVDTYTKAYTAAANSLSGAITVNVAKTGYTPLGIVGFACGSSGAAIEQALISGNTATLYIRNVTSSAISRDCTINVLYMAVV